MFQFTTQKETDSAKFLQFNFFENRSAKRVGLYAYHLTKESKFRSILFSFLLSCLLEAEILQHDTLRSLQLDVYLCCLPIKSRDLLVQ